MDPPLVGEYDYVILERVRHTKAPMGIVDSLSEMSVYAPRVANKEQLPV